MLREELKGNDEILSTWLANIAVYVGIHITPSSQVKACSSRPDPCRKAGRKGVSSRCAFEATRLVSNKDSSPGAAGAGVPLWHAISA